MATYRVLEAGEDEQLLAEIAALFGQGPGSPSIRPWGEPWDYGLVAEEAGEPVGAGWYRRHIQRDWVMPEEAIRAVFVGVRPDDRRLGIGSALWTRLLEAARSDEDVQYLVGMVTPDWAEWSVPRLSSAGFRERPGLGAQSTWLLGPLHGGPPLQ